MAKKECLRSKGTNTLKYSTSPEMTRRLGEKLGKKLSPGAVLALIGELGSGKTVFAQGILKGLGVKDRYMTSPSFVLIKEYKARLHVYHIDLFRLKSKEELNQLGIKEYLFGDGVTIVEWAEKVMDILPPEYLEVHFEVISARKRNIRIFFNNWQYPDRKAFA